MLWRLVLTRKFVRELDKLPPQVRGRVLSRVEELRANPLLGKPLRGLSVRVGGSEYSIHSLRVGKYRVLYIVDYLERTIYILYVGHRKDIYKGQKHL